MTTIAAERSSWLQPSLLTDEETLVRSDPFPFFVAKDVLSRDLMPSLLEDFPQLKGAGYLPYEKEQCGDTINTLIEHFIAPSFADAIGRNLGIEKLSQYPTYVSISRSLKKRHGNIHTDGKSKVATALLYLNPEWPLEGNGCLRFLKRIDDYEDTVVPEIKPIYGTLAAFKRTENSFHGHLPFDGQRLVIQVAWLVSEADKLRKARDGRISYRLKRLQGWLSQKFGRKDKSAA